MKKFLAMVTALVLGIGCGTLLACGGKEFDENKNITVVAREDGSGTKSAFMEIIGLKGKSDVSGVIVATGTVAVLQEVKGNPYAIAYDSLGYVTDEVKIVKIDGVEPTVDNIKSGTYKISRPLNVVYKQATAAEPVNQAFLKYIGGKAAQTMISEAGYISTQANPAEYTVEPGLSGEINITGSTSLKPLMEKLAAAFEKIQPDVSVTVGGGGSGTGYKDANNGVSDFGMISEKFNREKASDCTYSEVAKDGIAIIVNKNNPLNDISLANLKNIYDKDAGENAITKWSQVK